MANMSYCRFRNTRSDLLDCIDTLNDEEELSVEEASAARKMLRDILDFCLDHEIIENYDENAILDAVCEEV